MKSNGIQVLVKGTHCPPPYYIYAYGTDYLYWEGTELRQRMPWVGLTHSRKVPMVYLVEELVMEALSKIGEIEIDLSGNVVGPVIDLYRFKINPEIVTIAQRRPALYSVSREDEVRLQKLRLAKLLDEQSH